MRFTAAETSACGRGRALPAPARQSRPRRVRAAAAAPLCRTVEDLDIHGGRPVAVDERSRHRAARVPRPICTACTFRPDLARIQVAGHIELLVSVLRLNRQTARQFVTDDVLREMAVDIATAVRGNSPRDWLSTPKSTPGSSFR